MNKKDLLRKMIDDKVMKKDEVINELLYSEKSDKVENVNGIIYYSDITLNKKVKKKSFVRLNRVAAAVIAIIMLMGGIFAVNHFYRNRKDIPQNSTTGSFKTAKPQDTSDPYVIKNTPADTNIQNTPKESSSPNNQNTPDASSIAVTTSAPIKTPVKEVLSIVIIDEIRGEIAEGNWIIRNANAYLYVNGNPSDKKVNWFSDKERNIVINNEGYIEALYSGRNAVITAVLEDGRSVSRGIGSVGTGALNDDGTPLISVSMIQDGNVLSGNDIISGKAQLYVIINYADIDSGLIWTSSNPGAVSVNQNGQIEVLKSGAKATITFSLSDELYNSMIESGILREGLNLNTLEKLPVVDIDKITYFLTIET